MTLTPKLVNVSVNNGSVGGTIIKANVQGVGPVSNNSLVATLIDNSTGANLCNRTWIEEYGVLFCETQTQLIDNVTLGVKSYLNNSVE